MHTEMGFDEDKLMWKLRIDEFACLGWIDAENELV